MIGNIELAVMDRDFLPFGNTDVLIRHRDYSFSHRIARIITRRDSAPRGRSLFPWHQAGLIAKYGLR
jgi:hypothetical protein